PGTQSRRSAPYVVGPATALTVVLRDLGRPSRVTKSSAAGGPFAFQERESPRPLQTAIRGRSGRQRGAVPVLVPVGEGKRSKPVEMERSAWRRRSANGRGKRPQSLGSSSPLAGLLSRGALVRSQ